MSEVERIDRRRFLKLAAGGLAGALAAGSALTCAVESLSAPQEQEEGAVEATQIAEKRAKLLEANLSDEELDAIIYAGTAKEARQTADTYLKREENAFSPDNSKDLQAILDNPEPRGDMADLGVYMGKNNAHLMVFTALILNQIHLSQEGEVELNLDLAGNQELQQVMGGKKIDTLNQVKAIAVDEEKNALVPTRDLPALLTVYKDEVDLKNSLSLSYLQYLIQASLMQTKIYVKEVDHGDTNLDGNAYTHALNTLILAQLYANQLPDIEAGASEQDLMVPAHPEEIWVDLILGQTIDQMVNLQSVLEAKGTGQTYEKELNLAWEQAYPQLQDKAEEIRADQWQTFLEEDFKDARLAYLARRYNVLTSGTEMIPLLSSLVDQQIKFILDETRLTPQYIAPEVFKKTRIDFDDQANLVVNIEGEKEQKIDLEGLHFGVADVLGLESLTGGLVTDSEKTIFKIAKTDRLLLVEKEGKKHLAFLLKSVHAKLERDAALVLLDYEEKDVFDQIDLDKLTPDEQRVYAFNSYEELPAGFQEVQFWSQEPRISIGNGFSPAEVVETFARLDQNPWNVGQPSLALNMGELATQKRKNYDFYQAFYLEQDTPVYQVTLDNIGVVEEQQTQETLKAGLTLPIYAYSGVKESGWQRWVPGFGNATNVYILVKPIGKDQFAAVKASDVKVFDYHSFGSWFGQTHTSYVMANMAMALPWGRIGKRNWVYSGYNIRGPERATISGMENEAKEILGAWESGQELSRWTQVDITSDGIPIFDIRSHPISAEQAAYALNVLDGKYAQDIFVAIPRPVVASLPGRYPLDVWNLGANFGIPFKEDVGFTGPDWPEFSSAMMTYPVYAQGVNRIYQNIKHPKQQTSPWGQPESVPAYNPNEIQRKRDNGKLKVILLPEEDIDK